MSWLHLKSLQSTLQRQCSSYSVYKACNMYCSMCGHKPGHMDGLRSWLSTFCKSGLCLLCGLSSCAVCCSLSSCVWSSAVGPRGLSSCVCSSWSIAATTLPRSLSICRWTAVIRQNVLDGDHQGDHYNDHHDDECHDDDDV